MKTFWMILALLSLPAFAQSPTTQPIFAQAIAPREWVFPRDHGRHDGFKTEWWYFTGNLREKTTGRRFGYQLTFFRSAFIPHATTRPSAWGMTDLYFAHAAVSDVEGKQFHYADRLARGRTGLAIASNEGLDVLLKDWSVKTEQESIRLVASDAKFAIDLTAGQGRGPILQGPGGLNAKGTGAGQASYYYSMMRMPTTGTLTIEGRRFDLAGDSWMDHEFSSNALAENQSGWDWMALTLIDGSDLMIYRLRDKAGQTDYLSGTRLDRAGAVRYLSAREILFTPSKPWKSPASGATYPQEWRVTVNGMTPLTVRTRLTNQELQTPNSTDVTYYEGAVEVLDDKGAAAGEGYLEMTGYAKALPK
ncbi:MAG: secreted hydrolase-like protein [Phycisphaerales bacterium]|nr:secreted hydrolase-like protein [Phycisphaerales bacterium]